MGTRPHDCRSRQPLSSLKRMMLASYAYQMHCRISLACCQCHQVQTSHCPPTSMYWSQKSKLPGRSQHTLPAAAHFAQWHLWMAACLTLSMQRATWQILHPACMLSIGMSVGHATCKVYSVYTFCAKQQR